MTTNSTNGTIYKIKYKISRYVFSVQNNVIFCTLDIRANGKKRTNQTMAKNSSPKSYFREEENPEKLFSSRYLSSIRGFLSPATSVQ